MRNNLSVNVILKKKAKLDDTKINEDDSGDANVVMTGALPGFDSKTFPN
jgi:hypothetical protein